MTTYAFLLGRKSLLSIAEVLQMIDEKTVADICPEALIANLEKPLQNPQTSLNHLGGIVKIAEIFSELPLNQNGSAAEIIANYLIEKWKGQSSKLNYGISVYSLTQKHDIFLKKTLNFVKKSLTAAEIKSRFINKNFKNPENAAIKGKKILTNGAEIVIIQGNGKLYLGETKALQDFEGYSKRDYDRPARDPRLGMLPPKLAQMMINFSGVTSLEKAPEALTIYDPFCGIGTVLTEGLIMGLNVVGSDIEPTVIPKSQKNIEYILAAQGHPNNQNPTWRLFTKDATLLNAKDLPEKIDAIVTESYLGPPVSQFPLPQNMEKTFSHIRETILEFLKSMQPVLKAGTPIILSMPVYRRSDRFFFIENLIEKILHLGYETQDLIPPTLVTKYKLKLFKRASLVYDRPDQIVGREIWKFVKK